MKRLYTFATALLAVTPVPAQTVTFESEVARNTLVELYTSEGCSSCPPADVWMSKLKTNPGLWRRVVPVVFHVDYWDGLGWPDRFATAANTKRQRRYAAAWQSDTVYTPAFILNGREWRNWSQKTTWDESAPQKAGQLRVAVHGSTAQVSFKPEGGVPKFLQIELALLGNNLESNVKRGENSGRKLRHDFTVLTFTATPMRNEGGLFTATVPLAAKTVEAPAALAAWVTSGDAQEPIQATGGWLQTP